MLCCCPSSSHEGNTKSGISSVSCNVAGYYWAEQELDTSIEGAKRILVGILRFTTSWKEKLPPAWMAPFIVSWVLTLVAAELHVPVASAFPWLILTMIR
jgi:hypothetical protein